MKKELLLRYIKGEATNKEEREILEWIGKSLENERYFVTLNNLWISQNISDKKASKEELEAIVKLTTGKKVFGGRFRKYVPYAAAAVILLSAGLNFLLFSGTVSPVKKGDEPVRMAWLPTEYKHEIYTEKGVKARVILPDGSKVWLNSDSRMVYPDRFETDIREIEFSGEAYFDVVRDSLRPLVINTNKDFKVEVLGTKFNLKSYDNDSEARTTLYSGSVKIVSKVPGGKLKNDKEVVTKLKPLESCIIRDKQNPIHIKPENPEKQTAWKDGRIIFESTPMAETIKILERWHGVEFEVKDKSVYTFDITARFKSESIVQIMEMIKYCALIDYSIDSNKVVLYRRKL